MTLSGTLSSIKLWLIYPVFCSDRLQWLITFKVVNLWLITHDLPTTITATLDTLTFRYWHYRNVRWLGDRHSELLTREKSCLPHFIRSTWFSKKVTKKWHNLCLYQTEPPVRHVGMYTKTDTTCRLYHAVLPVGLRHVKMWPTRKVEEDKIMSWRDQSNLEVDMFTIVSTLDIGIDKRIGILNLLSTNQRPGF